METPAPLLEDWLRSVRHHQPSPSPSSSSRLSAQQVAQSWSLLRDCVQRGVVEEHHLKALLFLRDCGRTLHVAELQAKLLLPLLSPPPPSSSILTQALSSAAFLLSIWLRKPSQNKNHGEIFNGLFRGITNSLENHPHHIHLFIGEAILLLGALSNAQNIEENLKEQCHEAIAAQFMQRRHCILQGSLEEALAGAGYAMLSCGSVCLREIFRGLLLLWSESSELPPHRDLLLLLHLMEWSGSAFRARTQQQSAALIAEELSQVAKTDPFTPLKCAVVIAAAGLWKSSHESQKQVVLQQNVASGEPNWQSIKLSLEILISSMADDAIGSQASIIREKVEEKAMELIEDRSLGKTAFGSICLLQHWLSETGLLQTSTANSYWLQCVSLALNRCKVFPSRPSILLCLAMTLLNDAIPIYDLYTAQLVDLEYTLTNGCTMEALQYEKKGSKLSIVQEKLSIHITGLLFQEAGAITRAMCMQYKSVAESFQILIRTMFWEYSRALYESHRIFSVMQHKLDLDKKSLPSYSSNFGNETLKKMLEAIFLLIVMFFSFTLKERSTPGELGTAGFLREDVAILDSFSCVEVFRHVQVPDYGAAVLECVAKVASSEAASTSLLQMLPSYEFVLNLPGHASQTYIWNQDEIQTSRLLFYVRVLPSCLENMPVTNFVNSAAPLLFLYLQHPSQSLAEASHSLFATFLSSCRESESNSQSKKMVKYTIKEQLVAFYMQRSLEVFPRLTPFEGLVSGVGAIVRHLPPGSPATVHCFCCLAAKAGDLLKVIRVVGAKQFGNCAAEELQVGLVTESGTPDSEAAGKKLMTLIIHLMLLADLQVLPFLLREIANMILVLPSKIQTAALGDIFNLITDCDDFTRKPILVPWLQSLSYLCTKAAQNTVTTTEVFEPSRL